MTKNNAKASKIAPVAAKPKPKAGIAPTKLRTKTIRESAKRLPPNHPTVAETLPGTELNFLQLEAAIMRLWERNIAARRLLGLRAYQDIRSVSRPKGMKPRTYDVLCAEIDDTTFGMLEGLAGMWGHSIVRDRDADEFHVLYARSPSIQTTTGKKAKRGTAPASAQ